jgi:transcriptional regulator with XRE-family HTH domain
MDSKRAQVVVGRNVRECRTRRGWTQEQLAERCEMHTLEISRYERGGRDMRVSTVARLAKGLEVEALELMRGV